MLCQSVLSCHVTSTGQRCVLQYYQAQLNDIMMYSDLQPKVFQSLREVGNVIIFCLNVTHALVAYLMGKAPWNAVLLKRRNIRYIKRSILCT